MSCPNFKSPLIIPEHEKLIANIFTLARNKQPAIIFFDEIDNIFDSGESEHEFSRRIYTEILVQMSNTWLKHENICFIAATNAPWMIQMAILRRFEKRLYVSLPNQEMRKQILQVKLCKNDGISSTINEKDLDILSELTKNYDCAEIILVCKEICLEPCRKLINAMKFRVDSNGFYAIADKEDSQGIDIKYEKIENKSKVIIPPISFVFFFIVMKIHIKEDAKYHITKFKTYDKTETLKKFELWKKDFA